VRYLRRATALLRDHIVANPGAVRSIWSAALGFFAGAFAAAVGMALVYDHRLAYVFFLNTSLWAAGACVAITLNIGLLRDRDGYRLSAINAPLCITLLRVSLVPGIVLFLTDGHLVLALATYLVAVFSDVVDGWLARRWKQETQLGTVLDPLVDIVFNLTTFFALAASGLLPTWAFWVAALRYGILIVGGACLYLFVGPVRIRPTLFGRMTGVAMATLVGLLILLRAVGGPLSQSLLPLTEIALGVLLSATVIQVVVLGWYNLKLMTGEAARTPGRVVGDVRWGAP
jgi:cardiolipin synthase